MRVGYAKVGRSMPLTLEKCGNLGGDVEMAAVAGEFARRHPGDELVLIGRNSGENPVDVGLPANVTNPWIRWGPEMLRITKERGLRTADMSSEQQLAVAQCFRDVGIIDTIAGLDAIILWVGQHGTTNIPLPSVRNPSVLTKPQDWCAWYSSYLFAGVNQWRDADPFMREEIYLNADARNRHKMRDLKWPLRNPILTQFTFSHPLKHARYGDGDDFEEWSGHDLASLDEPEHRDLVWKSKVHNVYSRLEVNGLRPGTPFGDLISFSDYWMRPGKFGMFINEARAIGVRPTLARAYILKEWILPLDPYFLHGTWSDKTKQALGVDINPAPWDQYYPRLHSVKSTLTTPSSGSGWATAKPWEAFAAGTVCFFHPEYDTQDNILGDAPDALRTYLRVSTPKQLRDRVDELDRSPQLWYDLVQMQRDHFNEAMSELRYMQMIEKRIYG